MDAFFSNNAEDELSSLAQSQIKENDDSQQIIKTLTVINYLKVTVLAIIGFIMTQQIYYRMFPSRTTGHGNRKQRSTVLANRQAGRKRPVTRAEGLLFMLENNGCPLEQLHTLRNTVQNQDVKVISPEDLMVENKKRSDRRKEINRPKRSVMFNLEENKTREFRTVDIVKQGEQEIKSAERSDPQARSCLVKLKPSDPSESAANQLVTDEEPTEPTSEAPPAQEEAAGMSEQFETQSGDSSNQDEERVNCEKEEQSGLLPTLNEINQPDSSKQAEESKKAKEPVAKKKQEQKFEQASKVLEEDSPSNDDEAAPLESQKK